MTNVDPQRLVGAWQLVRWSTTYENGRVTEPLGPAAEGLLVYTDDGWMSASIMAAGRAPLSRSNPRAAPVEERAAAFDGYFGYCGRWRVSARNVEHVVTIALNPALVGSVQVRAVRLSGHSLTLSAEEPVSGGTRVHKLQWRRVAGTTADPPQTVSKRRNAAPTRRARWRPRFLGRTMPF